MIAAEKLITDNLEIWTSAIKAKSSAGRGSSNKKELYGIKKLRDLILDLAIRGLLVPQIPSEEPALSQLRRIESQKLQLLKAGLIKKRRPLSPIDPSDEPASIPEGWATARLGNVINVLNGRAFKKHEMLEEGVPILRVGNLFTSNEWYYSDLELEPEKYIDDGDLIYAWSASFGPFIWEGGKAIYHYHIWKMDFFKPEETDKYFFRHYLDAISASIKASGNGIAMIHLTKERMENLVIPLPPLEEQHRIVAKVDELMALCDLLEQQTEASMAAHQTLVETLLSALTNAPDHASFQRAWQRIAEQFDTLFTTEYSAEQLEKSILQLAVSGKLSPKKEEGETAADLITINFSEQQRLAREEKLKTKASETVDEQEKYIATPNHWSWVRLGNLAKFIDYRGRTPKKLDKGVRLITAKNVRFGYVDLNPEEFISEEEYDAWMTRGFPRPGDILFTPEAPLGNVAIVDLTEKFALAQRAICFQLHLPRLADYLLAFIMSEPFQEKLKENATGMTATGIKAAKLKEIPVPIPPLAEQRAITKTLDELRIIIKKMTVSVANKNKLQLNLADSMSREAIR